MTDTLTTPEIESTDPICGAPGCERPLFYSGKGRRPKYCDEHKSTRPATSSSKGRTSDDKAVAQACKSLDVIYRGIGLGLMARSPAMAQAWVEEMDGLSERNAMILEANPELARKLVGVGTKGGPIALLGSHVLAVWPVVMVGLGERQAAAEAAAVTFPEGGPFPSSEVPST